MSCPKGSPWTNCVDMPCTVDPQNSDRAICSCKIENTQVFFTFGGDCSTNTCATGFWSGATDAVASVLQNVLNNEVGSKENSSPQIKCFIN